MLMVKILLGTADDFSVLHSYDIHENREDSKCVVRPT